MTTFIFHNTTKKGFTLVEMMVSISIFAVVAVIAIGALLKIVDANKKAQSLETSINNLNFIFDSITREMRVGTNYYCTSDLSFVPLNGLTPQTCDTGGGPWTIAFYSSHGGSLNGVPCQYIYAYSYDGSQNLFKAQQESCGGPLVPYPLLSNDSALDTKVAFNVAAIKVGGSSTEQPYVRLHFKGTAGVKEKTKSAFDIQTTISQRLPN